MNKQKLSTFPSIETKRMQFRLLKEEDATLLFDLRKNDHVNKYIDRQPPETMDDIVSWIRKTNQNIINKECLYWAMNLKDEPELIGTICLWNFRIKDNCAEVGFELHPAYQSNGYAFEALSALADLSFTELELESLEAYANSENMASRRLLERCGFAPRSAKPEIEELNSTTGRSCRTTIYLLKRK